MFISVYKFLLEITIEVYLMRNEARRGTNAPYTLEIGID